MLKTFSTARHLVSALILSCLCPIAIAEEVAENAGMQTTIATNQAEVPISQGPNTVEAQAIAQIKAEQETNKKLLKEDTPYQQLIQLALKGHGTNGINSYKDAATKFCQQARDEQSAEAQYALGWMYANGKGVEKNHDVAAFFYDQAAQQSHIRARKALINYIGDKNEAEVPECMMPGKLPEPKIVLAPAGSTGTTFYKRGPIFRIVDRLAPQYHIETDLAMAFIKVESNFNPRATSPMNAQGLMQLIPATARRFNVKNPYDPEDNIKGGLAYLRWLMTYFEGDVRLVAAAYNAGENAVDRYKGVPPYRETKSYVTKIYNLYQKSYHPFQPGLPNAEKSSIIQVSSNP